MLLLGKTLRQCIQQSSFLIQELVSNSHILYASYQSRGTLLRKRRGQELAQQKNGASNRWTHYFTLRSQKTLYLGFRSSLHHTSPRYATWDRLRGSLQSWTSSFGNEGSNAAPAISSNIEQRAITALKPAKF